MLLLGSLCDDGLFGKLITSSSLAICKINCFHAKAASPLLPSISELLSFPSQTLVVSCGIEPINQRSLLPSDVPVFPMTCRPFISAAFPVPSAFAQRRQRKIRGEMTLDPLRYHLHS